MEKKVFAKGLCFWKYFCFFILGSLFGTFWEEILYFFQNHSYSNRSGVLYGPFSPLYGFGCVLILFFLGKNNEKRGIFSTLFLAAMLGGVTEYIVSYIIECVYHLRFWDYSNLFLNIFGRTTIPYMLAWGVFATIFLKIIYPFCAKWIERIPYKVGLSFAILSLIFLFFDMALTCLAFQRMYDRNQGKSSSTFIDHFCDEHYSDTYMYQKFPLLEGKFKK